MFISNVVMKQSGELFYDGSVSVLERGEYAIDSFTLQGYDISEYSIVHKNRNGSTQALAQAVSDRIAESCGIVVPVKSDKEKATGKEIPVVVVDLFTPALLTSLMKVVYFLFGWLIKMF